MIRNKEELLSHGIIKGREIALDIIEHSIGAVNSYETTKRFIHIDGEELVINNNLKYKLSDIKNIYVIGAGKATFPIAQALEEVLGDKIKKGAVNVKKGEKRRLKYINVREAGHPIPDEDGLEGAKEIVKIVKEAKGGDLVFCAITGGASALLPLPAEGISLEDKKKVTDLLLKCGAAIDEINVVRNHMSAIKGGKLAMLIHPGEIINLIVIDEVTGLPWGPTVPDLTTFNDAIHVLKKYNLWRKVPDSIKEYFKKGLNNPDLETPKPKDFKDLKIHNIILADNKIMCDSAKKRAEELGFNSLILSTMVEGESKELGIGLASIAKEVEKYSRPIKPPCCLILGGETTVKIKGKCGKGGPSQEFVLGASLKISESEKIVVASIDTDGTDGPTDIAGGIVDGYTLKRAKEKGIDVFKNLIKHNSSNVLINLQDAIFMEPTETNVMDLIIAIVLD
ncbi:MAG: DUF4147 domain-containing protein [Candidatus Bathyarchaeia archaeon]